MSILIVAEHARQILKNATYHTMAAAQQLGGEIDIVIIGSQCQMASEQATRLPLVRRVYVADAPEYEYQLAENTAPLIAELAVNYTHVLAPATTFGKNILPRAAALLDVALVSDVTRIMTPDTFQRPIYAGNAIASVQSHDKIKMLTIRTTAFAAANEEKQPVATVQKISQVVTNTLSRFEKQSDSIDAA